MRGAGAHPILTGCAIRLELRGSVFPGAFVVPAAQRVARRIRGGERINGRIAPSTRKRARVRVRVYYVSITHEWC